MTRSVCLGLCIVVIFRSVLIGEICAASDTACKVPFVWTKGCHRQPHPAMIAKQINIKENSPGACFVECGRMTDTVALNMEQCTCLKHGSLLSPVVQEICDWPCVGDKHVDCGSKRSSSPKAWSVYQKVSETEIQTMDIQPNATGCGYTSKDGASFGIALCSTYKSVLCYSRVFGCLGIDNPTGDYTWKTGLQACKYVNAWFPFDKATSSKLTQRCNPSLNQNFHWIGLYRQKDWISCYGSVTTAAGMLSFLLTDNSQGELSVNRNLSVPEFSERCETTTTASTTTTLETDPGTTTATETYADTVRAIEPDNGTTTATETYAGTTTATGTYIGSVRSTEPDNAATTATGTPPGTTSAPGTYIGFLSIEPDNATPTETPAILASTTTAIKPEAGTTTGTESNATMYTIDSSAAVSADIQTSAEVTEIDIKISGSTPGPSSGTVFGSTSEATAVSTSVSTFDRNRQERKGFELSDQAAIALYVVGSCVCGLLIVIICLLCRISRILQKQENNKNLGFHTKPEQEDNRSFTYLTDGTTSRPVRMGVRYNDGPPPFPYSGFYGQNSNVRERRCNEYADWPDLGQNSKDDNRRHDGRYSEAWEGNVDDYSISEDERYHYVGANRNPTDDIV